MKTAAGALTSGQLSEIRGDLNIGTNWSVSIANDFQTMANSATLVHDIRFGSAASGGTANITNLAALISHGALYNQAPPAAGQFSGVTHSGYYEYRPYTESGASSNYVFQSDGLNMVPTCDHDLSGTMVTQMEAGSTITNLTAEPMAKLGLSSTSALWIGRMLCVAYVGITRVEAFTSTTVTLRVMYPAWTGNIRKGQPGLIIWTTGTVLSVPSGSATGATSVTLDSAPPAGVVGMMVNVIGSDGVPAREKMAGTHVASIAGSMITVTAPGMQSAVSAGGYVAFIPRMRAPQYVSPFMLQEPGIGGAWLLEFDCVCPDNGAGIMPSTQYMDTIAAYNAAGGASIPMPTWASFWLYEAAGNGADVLIEDDGGAEIDGFEIWGGVYHGPANISSAYHALGLRAKDSGGTERWLGRAEGYPTYLRHTGTWEGYTVQGGASGDQIVGIHMKKSTPLSSSFKRQILWERDRVSIFLDGQLQTRWSGSWASKRGGRVVINASLGGMAYAGGNLNYPTGPTSLANARLIAKSLKVWKV